MDQNRTSRAGAGVSRSTRAARFRFGEFELDADRAILLRNGREVALRPKCFLVLQHLLRRHGKLVGKEELMDEVWPDVIVSDASLAQCMVDIRRALGDASKTMIRTVPRRGYLLDLPVTRPASSRESPLQSVRGRHPTRVPAVTALAAAVLLVILGFTLDDRAAGGQTAPQPAARSVATDPGMAIPREPPGTAGSALSTKAFEYISQGQFFHSRRAPGDIERAVAAFDRAVAEAPEAADAWAGLAGSLWVQAFRGGQHFPEFEPRVRQALERALALEPGHAEAHIRMSAVHRVAGQYEESRRHLEIAFENGRNSALVQGKAAGHALARGDLEVAIARQYRAVELDPLSFINRNNLGCYLFYAGRYAEARKQLTAAMDLNPTHRNEVASLLLAIAVLEQRYEDVAALAATLEEGPARDQALAFLHQATGDTTLRDQALARLARQTGFDAAFRLAEFHAQAGDSDEGFRWLNIATDRLLTSTRENNGRYKIGAEWRNSPFISHLTEDPRWNRWLARAGPRRATLSAAGAF